MAIIPGPLEEITAELATGLGAFDFTPAFPPTVSGNSTSIGASSLSDASGPFTPNTLIDQPVTRGASSGIVQSNTTTTLTLTAPWTGGTPANGAYTAGYTGAKNVMILPSGWTFDVIDNILAETNGIMTKPILTLTEVEPLLQIRTLGDHYGPGAGGLQRYGRRIDATISIGCWADRRLGGYNMCKRLASQVQGAVFINRVSLPAFRDLEIVRVLPAYEMKAGTWRADVVVKGLAVMSYDA